MQPWRTNLYCYTLVTQGYGNKNVQYVTGASDLPEPDAPQQETLLVLLIRFDSLAVLKSVERSGT